MIGLQTGNRVPRKRATAGFRRPWGAIAKLSDEN
jgi:hypothetical protein